MIKRITHTVLYIVLCLPCFISASAQKDAGFCGYADSIRIALYFDIGETSIDTLYSKNSEAASRLRMMEERQKRDSSLYVPRVEVSSSVSPENAKEANAGIRKERLDNAIEYIGRHIDLPQFTRVNFDGRQTMPIIWKELSTLVKKSGLAKKDEVLRILNHEDRKLARLYAMDPDHSTWNVLAKDFFPELRKTVVVIYFKEKKLKSNALSTANEDKASSANAKPSVALKTSPDRKTKKDTIEYRPVAAIMTNLACDAMLAPNIGIEIPIKNRASLSASYTCPWWLAKDGTWCYEMLYWEVGGKYWLGDRTEKKALTGHSLGLYCGAGLYDFGIRSKGMQSQTLINAGASYHYAKSLGKDKRWRLQFGAGIGVAHTRYCRYEKHSDSNRLIWQNDGKRIWAGPTKLEANIGCLLCRKKIKQGNKEKGGEE